MNCWDDLIDFIKDERVVPVVGPELLQVNVGGREVLLYAHIATVLAEEMGVSPEDLPPSFTMNDVVCRCLQTGKPPLTVYRRIRGILERADVAVPEPLLKLASIRPIKLFVTTTFDNLMEKALNQQRFGGAARTHARSYAPNQVRDEADLPADYLSLNEPTVFRLFGKASAMPDYVVTEEDTLEFICSLQTPLRRPNRLFDELKANNLLFIGNAFSDWLARFFVRLARGERFLNGGAGTMHYLSDDQLCRDHNFIYFLRSFGRNQVEIVSECGPIDFVQELYTRFKARYPNDVAEPVRDVNLPAPTPDMPDTIFLSYAREDSEAAHRVAGTLEAAGLTVWLDRNRIKHGEEWSEKIQQNIRSCALFFPIISRNTERRREGVFYEEWRCAEQRARRMREDLVFIVPIPVDDVPIPDRLSSKHCEVFPEGQLTPAFVAEIRQLLAKTHLPDGELVNAP